MKTFQFLLVLILVVASSKQSIAQEVVIQDGPIITFKNEVHDYGIIEYGADGTCFFLFTNTGNAPLIISTVKNSCGCIVPAWPKEPISPGETEQIKVRYHTGRTGRINKSLTVISNAVNTPAVRIRIIGEVLPKPVQVEDIITNPTN
jgi:hypothetical protein